MVTRQAPGPTQPAAELTRGRLPRVSRRHALMLLALAVPSAAALVATIQARQGEHLDPLATAVLAELRSFTRWLEANKVGGFIGEVGWPDDSEGDAAAWNALAGTWFAEADRAGLWVTAWATGEWWDRSYKLAAYYPQTDGAPIDTPNVQAAVLERHPSSARYQRGLNVAGGSFSSATVEPTSSFSNANPGTYDQQYHYDSQPTFEYLAGRGVRLTRIDFRWERLQPALGQPLDRDELSRLSDVVRRAGSAGLKVVLDLHNYGAYYLFDGTQGVRRPIGSPEVTTEHLADVWQRLSAQFGRDEHVLAYGLMNEPADLPAQYAATRTYETWEEGPQRWEADAGGAEVLTLADTPAHSGRRALKISKTFTTSPSYGHLRINDNGLAIGQTHDPGVLGDSLGIWVYLPPDAPGMQWQARLFVYGAGLASDAQASIGLVRGGWTLVTGRFEAVALRDARAAGLQVYANDVNGAAWVAVDDFSQGRERQPAELWQSASQRAVDAIRSTGDRKLIMVSGYGWSRAQDWVEQHPVAWIQDPTGGIRYEAHHYWDRDQSSFFRQRYADELAAAAGLQR